MKVSQLFTKTSKDAPADEVAKNAQLLTRAGYIYKVMAGVYAYTPLGLRVVEKIKHIVREEMNAIGGQELIMTNLQPKEVWDITTRWNDEVVDIWFKTKLKDDTEVGLAWSHEEAIMAMMKQYIKSYKDLPVYVYQFQTKLRNEVRAKSGIMRGREFVMKDMYSLSTDAEQHEKFYQETIEAYKRIYDRLGIGEDTYVTFASGGAFTQFSHEFQTLCDAGEDTIVKTSNGNWNNLEIAPSKLAQPNEREDAKEYQEVELPGIVGVQALIAALDMPIEKSTKTLIYTTEKDELVVAALRSDYVINELKLTNVVGCERLRLATDDEVQQLTGAETGYAGLVNLPSGVKLFLDDSLDGLCNFETGTNKTGYHSINVNFDRDIPVPETFFDFKEAKEGDLDPADDQPLIFAKAAEVGNIFNFGTGKSEQMDVFYTDESGKQIPVFLGSYGVGITRVMGVIVEKLSDDKGLVWPESVAPFKVYLVSIGEDPRVNEQSSALYEQFTTKGIEILFDDRDERAGAKFADSELLGIPYRITVSDRLIDGGQFELTTRATGETQLLTPDELLAKLA